MGKVRGGRAMAASLPDASLDRLDLGLDGVLKSR
jgi:hypothetical protein